MQFKNYIDFNKSQNKRTEFGCLMANVNFPELNLIKNQISEFDILKENIDSGTIHITILYGFHLDQTNYKDIAEDCKNLIKEPITDIILSDIGIFKNEEYDVLKFSIKSDTLNFLNSFFKKNYNYTNNFPKYNPHITIDYLYPGAGDKYLNSLDLSSINDIELISDELVYSIGDTYYKPFKYIPSQREIY